MRRCRYTTAILFVSERLSYRSAASLSLLRFLATAGTAFALLGAFSVSSTVPFPPSSERVTFFRSRLSTSSTSSVLFSSFFFRLAFFSHVPIPRHALRVFSFFSSFSSARDFPFCREFRGQCRTITACAVRHWCGSNQWFRVFTFRSLVMWIRSAKFFTIFLMHLVAFVIFVHSSSASALLYTLRRLVRQSGRLRFASGIKSQSRRPRWSRFRRPSNSQLTYTSLIVVKFAQVTHLGLSATAKSIVSSWTMVLVQDPFPQNVTLFSVVVRVAVLVSTILNNLFSASGTDPARLCLIQCVVPDPAFPYPVRHVRLRSVFCVLSTVLPSVIN